MAGGQIFQGVTTAPARDYVAKEIIKYGAEKVYMPACGRFGASQAYINHGGKTENLFNSDISLFSSIIGYLADDEKDFEDLGIINNSEIKPVSDEDIDVATAVMLALRLGQVKDNNKYNINTRREIIRNQEKLLENIKKQLIELCDLIKGSHYEIRDLREIIEEVKDDEKAAIYLNVPTYSGGYEKMFKNSNVEWNVPELEQFDYKDFGKIIEDLKDAKCLAIIYAQKTLDLIPENYYTAFAQPFNLERTDYLVMNKKPNKSFASVKIDSKRPMKYEIYNDEEITEDSKIEFVQVDEDTCMYYRDLFVHKLGTTTAESFWLMLIDNRVTTAFGLSMRDVFTRKTEYVGEVFGITRTSYRYKFMGKLFMLFLTSGEFKKILESKFNLGLRKIKGIKTSSLTTHPEGKTDRGVMKLTFREKLKNGNYRVIYQGDFRDDDFKEVLVTWLKRYGKRRRK